VRPASIHFLWFVHVIEVFFPEYFSGPVFPEEKSLSGQIFFRKFSEKKFNKPEPGNFFQKIFPNNQHACTKICFQMPASPEKPGEYTLPR